MNGALFAAREILTEITPLKTDCGRLCQAACCASLEGEETGMLLFPGEEVCYENRTGWHLQRTETGSWLLICSGTCVREDRPLSCRFFPLLPEPAGDEIRIRMDARAGAVCPLRKMGLQALDPAFAEAVRRAGMILLTDKAQRTFLEQLAAEQRELRQLKVKFRFQAKG